MKKKRILVVSQEINPYLEYTNIGKICNALCKQLQLKEEAELRVLMPRFGNINERRHKLHEVVRLSGINVIMNDEDHPLIIKVASMPGVRIQVYFLDNEDFFKRKSDLHDEKGKFHADNADRMVFFAKGALEIVKKFGWPPDLVLCHGWMTSLLPMYLKTAYKKEPVFSKAKVVYSVYNNPFTETLSKNFFDLATHGTGIKDKEFELYKPGNYHGLQKGAIQFADGLILGDETMDKETTAFLTTKRKPTLKYNGLEDGYLLEYSEFFKKLLAEK